MQKNKDNPFFLYLSFNAVHTPMQATPKDLEQINKFEGNRRINAAMTLALDRACGKVLDKLNELNLANNTIVIFTNDNGGPSDTNASINDPLSGTKATHLEGGIRVPFLMRWPGKLKANTIYDKPISTLDLLPTFVNAAGGDATSIEGLDGVDLLPHFQNPNGTRPHQTLYWKKATRAAIRDGDWKLIRLMDRPAELYNLESDESEKYDLATKHPDKMRELYKKLFEWEIQLERPLWQLKYKYEGWSHERYENFKKK
jgi:arylsulfatase A-like enzyme